MLSNGYTSKCSGPYWSNPPFVIFWHLGAWHSRLSAIRKGGLDQYGVECFGRLVFATIRKNEGPEGLTIRTSYSIILKNSIKLVWYRICRRVVIRLCGVCIAAIGVLSVVVAGRRLLISRPPSCGGGGVVERLVVRVVMLLIIAVCCGRCGRLLTVMWMTSTNVYNAQNHSCRSTEKTKGDPSPPVFPFPPSEVGPLNSARGLAERCKLPQQGLGWRPSRNWIWCILALKFDIWWQQL